MLFVSLVILCALVKQKLKALRFGPETPEPLKYATIITCAK